MFCFFKLFNFNVSRKVRWKGEKKKDLRSYPLYSSYSDPARWTLWEIFSSISYFNFHVRRSCAAVGRLTAHGLAGVDLLSHEELLQLPDVHPGLGHVLWVPALRRTAVLGGVITWRDGQRWVEDDGRKEQRETRVKEFHPGIWTKLTSQLMKERDESVCDKHLC